MSQRKILYGYGIENGKFVVVPMEAEIVKEAFQRYIGGETFQQIADSFTHREITYYRDNRTWNKNLISRVVGDSRYIGNAEYPSVVTSEAYGLSVNMRKGKSRTKTELPEITEVIKSKLICGECGQRIRRINKWRTREKWLCSAGCKCEIYLDDKFLFDGIRNALKRFSDGSITTSQEAEYKPTPDITRQTNEIYRKMEQSKVDFKEIANLILTCASDKYDCCHIQRNGELSKALLPEYVPLLNEETIEPTIVERVIEQITVYTNGSIKLRLFSGEEITEEVESNECSTEKDSNED